MNWTFHTSAGILLLTGHLGWQGKIESTLVPERAPFSGTTPKSPICVHFWHEVSLLHPSELSQSEYPHCHPERSDGSSRDRVHFCYETALGSSTLKETACSFVTKSLQVTRLWRGLHALSGRNCMRSLVLGNSQARGRP